MSQKLRAAENGEAYIAQYPKMEKWVHRCGRCGTLGCKPEINGKENTSYGHGFCVECYP